MLLRSLRIALWSLSIAGSLAFAVLGGVRTFQLPLDDTERQLLTDATRIAAGQPLYVGPGPTVGCPAATDHLPMPGLPLVTAALVGPFGAAPWTARLPGLVAGLVAALLAAWLVRTETGNGTLAVVAPGIFLGGLLLVPELVGRGSPEIAMVALAVSGYAALRRARGVAGALAGSALLVAAALVHPLALCWIIAAIVHLAMDDRRRAVVFGLAVAALGAGACWLVTRTMGPGLDANAAGSLSSLTFHPGRALRLIGEQLLGRYGVLTLVAVLSVALPVRPWRGAGGIWTWMAAGAIAGALLTTQTSAAESLALVPSILALAIIGPVAMQRVARHLSAWPGSTRVAGQHVVLVALVLQFTAMLARLPAALSRMG